MTHQHLLIHQEIENKRITILTFPSYPAALAEYQARLARDKYRMERYHLSTTGHSYNIRSFTGQHSKLSIIKSNTTLNISIQ